MFGNWIAPLASMGFGLIQAGGSGVLFVIIGGALDKSNMKNRLLDMNT